MNESKAVMETNLKEDGVENSLPALPPKIMHEILSRTSLETLGRCRVVSKSLNKITYDPSFTQLFCQRNKVISGFFLRKQHWLHSKIFVPISNGNPETSDDQLSILQFLPSSNNRIDVLATTNSGFLLCKKERQYFVCKPKTKQGHKIPNPGKSLYSYQIKAHVLEVLKLKPLHYKVFRFSSSDRVNSRGVKSMSYCCDIYDSETSTWKNLNNVITFEAEMFCTLDIKSVVSSAGTFYWLRDDYYPKEERLFGFDSDRERCRVVALPEELSSGKTMELVEYEGRLGLISIESGAMELWVKEKANKWTKIHRVCMKEVMKKNPNLRPLALYNNNVAIIRGDTDLSEVASNTEIDLIFFNFGNCSFKVYRYQFGNLYPTKVLALPSDSEPPMIKSNLVDALESIAVDPSESISGIITTVVVISCCVWGLCKICRYLSK